jgi:hypothetical protein
MTTRLLDLVPFEDIEERAQSEKTKLSRIILIFILSIPFFLGWLAAKTAKFVRLLVASLVEGWEHGLSGSSGEGNRKS